MTALSAASTRPRRKGDIINVGVKSGAQIYQGGLVVALAGFAIAGRVAASAAELATMKVLGVASADALGAGADGDTRLNVDQFDAYRFANSAGGDQITAADIGNVAFLVDDNTVAKTIGNGRRPIAGEIDDVDAGGVWIKPGSGHGLRRIYLPLIIDDLRGAQARVYRVNAPRAGAITRIFSVLDAALATGDATLTAKIGATNVTGGLVTVVQAGSAAGQLNSAEATALNVVAEGDIISLTVGGPNTAQVATRVLIEITY